jgi:amino acid adenylation domain-containing protein
MASELNALSFLQNLSLLTQVERHQLPMNWNNTQTEYAQTCIHQLVEAVVELSPDAPAVVFEQSILTYRQLNSRANVLAHYLQALGVGPEVLVGICMERSLEMVVGLLGILKAGGAYVPLDPAYPTERLAFMLEDTQISVLLTQARLVESLPKHQAHVVCLDTQWEEIAFQSEENPISAVTPDNLAYVIYTSGSTGRPKGVAMCHRPLSNLIIWQRENSTQPLGAKTLQFAPVSFDVSFQEIFSTVCSGGTLVLISEQVRVDAFFLLRFLADQEINRLFLPFVALQQLASVADTQGAVVPTLREIQTSGEQLKITRPIASWFTKLQNCTLHNHYGPTESHVVTAFTLTGSPSDWPALPPIGRPIANTQIYLLDSQMQPVPSGVPGELYIGGIALARGYLNRPDLTQERFIPNPNSSSPQARLYKTGDLARYLPDGNIEFLGRSDDQVKIRGFRIELGEIEVALAAYPAVRQAVVLAREDVPGDKRLAAYIVPNSQESPPYEHSEQALVQAEQVLQQQNSLAHLVSQLRSYLKERLPDYMVPSAFVVLEAFPLTPSGKVNRRALPVPEIRPADLPTFVAPRTPIEEMLASIWANILRVDEVGIHDNFFTLGGDSLLAVQIIARMRVSLGVELPFSRLLEFPTVAGLALIVEEFRKHQLPTTALPLQPMKRNQTIPLSFSQEQLWFLHQLIPEEPVYNEPCTIRLKGAINVDALEKALNEIIKRHESWRTRFITVDGQPVQVIEPPDTFNLTLVDLRQFPLEQREAEALRLATKQAKQPFDLTSDLLLRATLMQLADVDYRLFLTFHHIVMDDVSIQSVFLKELTALYEAYSIGKPSPLAPLPVQYADFAVWQRQRLTPEILSSHLDYWKQQLADLPVLQLPYDRPRPAVGTFRGAWQCLVLSKELTESLKALSQQEGVTLYMTLLAAFKTLLYRYSGSDDIVVGTFSAGRNRPEIEGLMGFFLNTLVLRTDMSGNPSFRQLLGRVREVTLGAYAHEDLPYPKLVQTLQPGRNLSQNPLFQVAFVLEAPRSSLNLDWTRSYLDIQTDTAKLELTLELDSRPEGIVGRIEYNTDLFEAATISRMIEHFKTMLAGIVANPQAQVSELPLLTEAERYQLLVEWNNTTKEYPIDKCIHQLFEEQVERSPDAIAVVFEDKQLTYRELNQRANRIAHYLQHLGVRPEVLVGICVERSLEMVVGLLGILKAGGAYVPLDPTYPPERIAYILSDSQVPILLTQKKLVASLPESETQIVFLDTDDFVISPQSSENPDSGASASNLAYMIYTSGSTGTPKGVLIPHSGLLNLIFWHQRAFDVTSSDRVTQLAGTAFDASVWELYPYLAVGASIYLVSQEILLSLEKLRDWLLSKDITITFVPTPLAEKLLSEQWPQDGALRIMLTGGDKLHQYPSASIPFKLVNNYGPTENTVVTTSGLVVCNGSDDTLPHIGRPVANTQIYILDHYFQPVPVGVAGELYIGGDGLGRGYLNRADLTQEKFISNPFNNESGSRLYKTGDKARYLPDGNIEFLGRLDNQVKIRGFRIELGEIEAAIAQHPGVREIAVMAREDVPGQKYLAAYIVPNHQKTLASSDLRGFLKDKLPDFMIPGAFVYLDVLPLTPNGKVDCRALPAPKFQPELQRSLVAPRTPIEEMLASIWTDVLKIELVGVHHNFFELGGHSLLATQVISRVRDTLAVELPLRSLFEAPTIAEFASRVEHSLKKGQSQEAEPLLPIPRSESIPLSFAQARLWFLDQLQLNSAFYNIPFALRLSGQLNIAALQSSINEIIRRHEALRTNFTTQEGQPVAVIAATLNCQLQVMNLLHIRESSREIEAQRLAMVEANRPFNLEREPLLRSMVLQLGETEYVLLFTMHHIISDGWSLGVFTGELTELYKAFCTGITPVLPSLPVQYADFALWQRQWLQGEILRDQLDYWKQQLNDAPALLELPTDRPRSADQTYRGGYHYAALSKELSAELTALTRRAGVTLFMTLLAAFVTLLYRLLGQDDIVVGTPVAGRNRREIEGLIGFFVNTLVLRTNLSDSPSFEDVLSRVREVALQAYTHQDLPFEQLVEALQPTRDLSYTPLFQVMFALNEKSVPSVELPELMVSSYAVEIGTAKFDLTLSMENTADGLVGAWGYNVDLFDETTIARLTGHFQTLVEGIVANPTQKVSSLPLFTIQERHQLLVEWNNTTQEYPQDKCIHQLFEEQVELTPDAVAVVFEDKQLTYLQLNQRANKIAHHLRTLGVGPEVLVGLCVERSLEMIVGLLGILKAGGAYVPLDPAYPLDRLSHMLLDSQVSVVLTTEKLVAQLPEHTARMVRLDADWNVIEQMSQENPLSNVQATNLAYVIYTSGSTGKPKGITIEHRSVLNLATGLHQAIYAHYQDSQLRVSVNGSLSFDTSVKQIIQLLYGHTLEIVPEATRFDGNALLSFLQKHKIDVFDCTPSQLYVLIAAGLLASKSAPLAVLVGGEKIDSSTWLALRTSENIDFYNVYGPTECTVDATVCSVKMVGSKPVIGLPITNTQIYILDRHLQPVGVGVAGELYIGGDSLARGYLNRPDLTREKFIPNPFNNEPSSRLYKTGDKVRYLSDGNIEFLGRFDNQVKIRGFRIELGEIEAAITLHSAVRETVVIVREDIQSDKRLVAYIVPIQVPPTCRELRHFLLQKLPDYMVPNAIVVLSAMPLTPNGKVDRRALPAPDSSPSDSTSFVPPRDAVEQQLQRIWSEVLQHPTVGVGDSFFELGGHSLLAVRLMAQIQQHFGLNLPLATLLASPTIEQLASCLRASADSFSWSPLVAIQSSGDKRPFFCVPGVGGNVIYFYELARHLGLDQPFYGFSAKGLDGESEPFTRVEDIAAYYIEAMQTLQPNGPYLLGGHSFGGVVAFEMAQQLLQMGHEVALVAIIDAIAPIVGNKPNCLDEEEAANLFDFASYIEYMFSLNLEVSKETLADLTAEQQLHYLKERLIRVNLLPSDAGIMLVRGLVQVYMASLKAHRSYLPEGVLPTRIALFRAQDIDEKEGDIEELLQMLKEPTLGWKEMSGTVDVHVVPGNHMTMMAIPHVKVLAEQLQVALSKHKRILSPRMESYNPEPVRFLAP